VALKEQINNDLKAALLGGNHFAAETLRGLKSTILNEEVTQGKRDEGLDDLIIQQLVAKEVKKRNESATIYDNAGRPELANDERNEAKILAVYLPEQLSEAEIIVVINKVIGELGVSGPAAMGQIIGPVKKELGSSADSSVIARLVKNALN
jgi:uncharacterized protein YqeY